MAKNSFDALIAEVESPEASLQKLDDAFNSLDNMPDIPTERLETSYDALDALESLDAQSLMIAETEGRDISPEEVQESLAKKDQAVSQGLDVKKANQEYFEHDKVQTFDVGVSTLEQMIMGQEEDVESVADTAKRLGKFDPNRPAWEQQEEYDTFFDNYDMALAAEKERKQMKEISTAIFHIGEGKDPAEHMVETWPELTESARTWEKLYKDQGLGFYEFITNPAYSHLHTENDALEENWGPYFVLGALFEAPLAAGVTTLLAQHSARTGIKEGSKQLAKEFLTGGFIKEGSKRSGLALASFGAMDQAHERGYGTAVSLAAGVVGPLAAVGLVSLTRKSLKSVLMRWKFKNPAVLDQLKKQFVARKDVFSKRMNEVMAEVDEAIATDMLEHSAITRQAQSAGAREVELAGMADDINALKSADKAAVAAVRPEPMGQQAAKALDTQEATFLGIHPTNIDPALQAEMNAANTQLTGITAESELATSVKNATTVREVVGERVFQDTLQDVRGFQGEVGESLETLAHHRFYLNSTGYGPGTDAEGVLIDTAVDFAGVETGTISHLLLPQESAMTGRFGVPFAFQKKFPFAKLQKSGKAKGKGATYSLVDVPTAMQLQASRIRKFNRTVFGQMVAPLKQTELAQYNQIVRIQNDMGEWLIPVEGGFAIKGSKNIAYPCSPQTQNAVLGTRKLLELNWQAQDMTVAQVSKKQGWGIFDSEFYLAQGESPPMAKIVQNPKGLKQVRLQNGEVVPWSESLTRYSAEEQVIVDSYTAKMSADELGEMTAEEFTALSSRAEEIIANKLVVVEFNSSQNHGLVSTVMPEAKAKSLLGEIPLDGSVQLTGKLGQYVPIEYTDPYHIVELIQKEGMTVSANRVATAGSSKLADDGVQEALLLAKESQGAQSTITKDYVAVRSGKKSSDLITSPTMMENLRQMSPNDMEIFFKTLEKSGTFPKHTLDRLKAEVLKTSYKKTQHQLARGEERLPSIGQPEPAIKPSSESIAGYLDQMSTYIGGASYFAELEQAYLKEFGHLLTNPEKWNSGLLTQDAIAAGNFNELKNALFIQQQMKAVAATRSTTDIMSESAKNWSADKMIASKNPIINKFGRSLDVLPHPYQAGMVSKGVASTTLLGMWNLAQFPLQASLGITMSVGVSAGRGFESMIGRGVTRRAFAKSLVNNQTDFVQAIAPHIWKSARLTKRGQRVWNDLERSGLLAEIDFDLMKQGFEDMKSIHGKMGQHFSSVADASTIPWKAGEQLSRLTAFINERNFMLAEIESTGRAAVKTENGVVSYITDSTSDAFIQEATRRSMKLSMNMTRINKPLSGKGLQGIPMQFKEIGQQVFQRMFNTDKAMSKGEMIGMWGAWVGLFGTKGVPFMWDAMLWAEDMGVAMGHPEASGAITQGGMRYFATTMADVSESLGIDVDRETFYTWLTLGSDAVATEGTLSAGSRVTISEFFNHWARETTLADDLGGPAYQVMSKFALSFNGGIEDFALLLKSEYDLAESAGTAVKNTLNDLTDVPPGMRNPKVAMRSLDEGVVRSQSGKVILNSPTLSETILMASGFRVGSAIDDAAMTRAIQNQKMAWKEWAMEKSNDVAKMMIHDEATAQLYMQEYMMQVGAYNPKLASAFARMVYSNRIKKDFSAEDQRMLAAAQEVFISSSFENGWNWSITE